MNSFEKYGKMLSMTPYSDRSEMPIMPMLLATYGPLGGKTQKEILDPDPQNWLDAMAKTWELYGKPDVSMAMEPLDTTFIMGLPVRLPGREIGENELYQFVETPYFDDPDEYDKILQMGFQNWKFGYLMDINKFQSPDQLGARFGQLGANIGRTIGFLIQNGVVPCFETAMAPIFDDLSMIRSMQEFTYDMYDCPEKIMDIIQKNQEGADIATIQQAKQNGVQKIGIFAMRSCATFISPALFEEYVWPELKKTIIRFHEAGLVSVLHADGNWLPMVPYFTELPKGCLHLELDGDTDIEEAYGILKGHQTIRGDVPATLFAFGSPDEITEYSEKLIKMGMDGGFMLSSGCEVPLNVKPENYKAFMDVLK